jgi:opacity protein-like surface antigen
MKKLTILIAALVVLIPSLAYSDMMTIRLGYYMPNAFNNSYLTSHPNSLFAIELNQMSFLASDFRGSILGGGYEFFMNPRISFAISVDTFSRENGGSYLDYTGITLNNTDFQGDYAFPYPAYTGDFPIQHSMHVSLTPIQFSVKFTPLGRKTRLIPYVGGGVGAYFVSASISGEIADFSAGQLVNDPNRPELGDFYIYPVVLTYAHETRLVLGEHVFAGLMFPIGYRLTLEAEARYHFAKANFQHAFPAVDYGPIDLSGLGLSIGLNYWF